MKRKMHPFWAAHCAGAADASIGQVKVQFDGEEVAREEVRL